MFTGYNVNTNTKRISIKTINTEIRNNVLCKTLLNTKFDGYILKIFLIFVYEKQKTMLKK